MQKTYVRPNGKRYAWGMSTENSRGRDVVYMTQLHRQDKHGAAFTIIVPQSEVENRWEEADPTPEDLAFFESHIKPSPEPIH